MHGSEDALATLACRRIASRAAPHVLIGGLGMGFTLRAALDVLPPAATVVVAELVPAVVAWNRGPLGPLAGHPLDDARVRVEETDVAVAVRSNPGRFDAVLLDVDNGSDALTTSTNGWLYGDRGVDAHPLGADGERRARDVAGVRGSAVRAAPAPARVHGRHRARARPAQARPAAHAILLAYQSVGR